MSNKPELIIGMSLWLGQSSVATVSVGEQIEVIDTAIFEGDGESEPDTRYERKMFDQVQDYVEATNPTPSVIALMDQPMNKHYLDYFDISGLKLNGLVEHRWYNPRAKLEVHQVPVGKVESIMKHRGKSGQILKQLMPKTIKYEHQRNERTAVATALAYLYQ